MELIKKIQDWTLEEESIRKEISKIINIKTSSPIEFNPISHWEIETGDLYIYEPEDGDDYGDYENYYGYTLSSEGNLGEKFFMGESEGFTYVLAYDDDWENSIIFILHNSNKVNTFVTL